jgi:hypothetical protein
MAFWLLTGTLGTTALALAAAFFVKLASAPNATVWLHLPAWIDALTERNDVAYPLHAMLGTGFNLTPGTAAAAGIQWMKAANHARSPHEMAAAVRGISTARGFAPYPTALDVRIAAVAKRQDPRVRQVMHAAGLTCGAQQ